ncbi:MAG: DUF3108 domain-containing protein [Dehalococcoidia bacterium]
MRTPAGWWAPPAAVLGALALLVSAACDAANQELPTQEVVSSIPWTVPEEAVHRIVDGDEVIGSGVLGIGRDGPNLRLTQEFEFPERRFTDTVEAVVDAQTLKPRSVERVLTGPDGERRWQVEYFSGVAEVNQTGEGGQRTDRVNVPEHSYDKWSEIFVWRTIDFLAGYRAAYFSIITADLDKPKQAQIVLQVVQKETVSVPAGRFEVWRLEIRQGGQRQVAWVADTTGRELVRYDNGSVVFELEELR